VGSVTIWNSKDTLSTLFVPAKGWNIQEIQYHPTRYYRNFPTNKDGSLNYLKFTFRRVYNTPVMGMTFESPLTGFQSGDDVHLAVRMVLVQVDPYGAVVKKTVAWAEGKRSYNGALYFKHILQPCTAS